MRMASMSVFLRVRMPILAALAAFAASAPCAADPCDQKYLFDSAYQVILSGPTADSLKPESTTALDETMSDAVLLHADTEYRIITGFDAGTCGDWEKASLMEALRKKNDTAMAAVKDTSRFIKFNRGPFPDDSTPLVYWFGFADSLPDTGTVKVVDVIGQSDSGGPVHIWYGTAVMVIKRKLGGNEVPLTFRYPKLNSHPDSAALQALLVDPWKKEANNDTQKVSIKVQLIRVTYDTVHAANARRAPRLHAGFAVSRSGEGVLIRAGEGWDARSGAPSLVNLAGAAPAALRPEGAAWRWDGRTANGAKAPAGIYFLRSGVRILGRFFFSR
jgi:hypothetical protein